MNEDLDMTPQMEFFRDIDNYVLINNEIYRKQFSNPDQLNPTAIQKTIFMQKFGFSQEDYLSLREFDGWTNEPEHFNYREDVGAMWNLYNKIDINTEAGDWSTLKQLWHHTYGKNSVEEDQTEELYDYHTVMLKWPKQIQQARILYSHTQGTAKSAVARIEQEIFKENYVKLRDSELSGDFNMLYCRSLLIHLDEPYFGQPASMERKLRDMITATTMNMRKMKTDHVPVPFYGKFIFTTNDSNFMPINPGDRRYWIREVPPIAEENKDAKFLDRCIKEIPHYLHYLLHEREMKHKESADVTFWLPYESITKSNAFKKMVKDSESELDQSAREIIENWFMSHPKEQDVYFRLKDLKQIVANEMQVRFDSISSKELTVFLRDKNKIEAPDRTTRPTKKMKILTADIDKVPGKWWRAERKNFQVDVKDLIFTDVRL